MTVTLLSSTAGGSLFVLIEFRLVLATAKKEELANFVVGLGSDLEVPIKKEDISVVHHVGKSTQSGRPVICKFIYRNTKDKLMKKKKTLKDIPKYNGKIFLNHGLTKLRARSTGSIHKESPQCQTC